MSISTRSPASMPRVRWWAGCSTSTIRRERGWCPARCSERSRAPVRRMPCSQSEDISMKLYLVPPSGNAYKVRILLSLLNVPYEKVVVDSSKQENKQPAFLKLNPRGEVPVLEDNGTVIWDSAACLAYVARKHGGEQWLPSTPKEMAEVMQWIALAASEIQFGLQYGRRGVRQGRWTAGNQAQCQAIARVALGAMEGRLKNQ